MQKSIVHKILFGSKEVSEEEQKNVMKEHKSWGWQQEPDSVRETVGLNI